MGKTLKAYFNAFNPDEIAQFYIHSQIPTDISVCKEYYRFTDIDAVKSIFSFGLRGKRFSEENIDISQNNIYEDAVKGKFVYGQGESAAPIKHILRDAAWKFGHWFTKDLKNWLKEISPDIIFLAAGNYSFIYDVALKLAEYSDVPIVISCFDDFYINDPNKGKFLSAAVHRNLLKKARAVFSRAAFATVVCEKMAEAYERLFGTECMTLYTGAEDRKTGTSFDGRQISYIGNIGLKRHEQLLDIGACLKESDSDKAPKMLDLYSGERKPEILKLLSTEKGINFHGAAAASELAELMRRSMALIHTEAFDSETSKRVSYSVSTKIADSLMNGPCLIAYGPRGIASVDYLAEHKAAYVIDSREKLKSGLREIIENPKLRESIVLNARRLAAENHDVVKNGLKLRRRLEDAVSAGNS